MTMRYMTTPCVLIGIDDPYMSGQSATDNDTVAIDCILSKKIKLLSSFVDFLFLRLVPSTPDCGKEYL